MIEAAGTQRRRIALGAVALVLFGVIVGYRCAHHLRPARHTPVLPGCRFDSECALWPWLGFLQGVCTQGKCHVELPPPTWIATEGGWRLSCFE